MMMLTGVLRYAGIFVLLWSVSACSERQEATDTGPDLVSQSTAKSMLSVYKNVGCGCCGDWINHIESSGFNVSAYHPADLSQFKSEKGISRGYESCHTTVSQEGYVFEGHIPAKYVQQFLDNPPVDAIGLAVPAMPIGSPGMETGDRFSPYQVLLLKKDGRSAVFAQVDVQGNQYQ